MLRALKSESPRIRLMIARPGFVFTAESLRFAPPEAGDGDGVTSTARNSFLLIPDLASLDYFLYCLRGPLIAARLVRDPGAVGPLIELVQGRGALPPGMTGPWGTSQDYRLCDRVAEGAFFAAFGGKKHALKVLIGRPLVYSDASGRPVQLAAAENVTRIETPFVLSVDAYQRVRQVIQRLPKHLAGWTDWRHVGDGGDDRRESEAGDTAALPPPRPPRGPRRRSFNGGLPPWAPRDPTAPRWEAGRPMSRRVADPPD
jgi:hypothetical protein